MLRQFLIGFIRKPLIVREALSLAAELFFIVTSGSFYESLKEKRTVQFIVNFLALVLESVSLSQSNLRSKWKAIQSYRLLKLAAN